MLADAIPIERMNKKRTVGLTRFTAIHVVARGNHHVGWPPYVLAKPVEDRHGGFHQTIKTISLSPNPCERANPVMTIG